MARRATACAGLSTGADDYLVKPFSTPEFVARVKALLRRAKPEVLSSVLKVGDIMLDREAHRVYRKKNEIKLGPTEFRLLEFMMRHPGRVFSRSQLLDNVWGETIYIDERTVDVHVGRLRKAVNNGRMPDVIRTVRGAGYAIAKTEPPANTLTVSHDSCRVWALPHVHIIPSAEKNNKARLRRAYAFIRSRLAACVVVALALVRDVAGLRGRPPDASVRCCATGTT